jgi:flavin reductase (DIM6/NTAB) family NADH-FMN oxidoreductase RutF
MIDCSLEQIVELGDHNLIVGRVQHLHADADGETVPMVFHKGQYGTFG